MNEAQIERRKMVTLPHEEFEEILERAAEREVPVAQYNLGLSLLRGQGTAPDERRGAELVQRAHSSVGYARLELDPPRRRLDANHHQLAMHPPQRHDLGVVMLGAQCSDLGRRRHGLGRHGYRANWAAWARRAASSRR